MSRIRRWRWLKLVVGLVVIVVVVGGGYAAYAAKTGGPAGYRTATVEKADVEQTVTLSGTVSQLGESDLSFGASGTVAAVRVGVGDRVRKDQVLATLDAAALQAAVTKASATLAAAQAQLATDKQAEIDQATGTSTTGGATGGTTKGTSGGRTDGGTTPGGTYPGGGTTPGGTYPGGGTTHGGGTPPKSGTSPSGGSSGTPGGSQGDSDTAAMIQQIKAAQAQVQAAQEQLDDAQAQLTDSSTGAKTYLANLSTALQALDGSLAEDGDLATALADAKADCGSTGDASKCGDDIQAAIDALGDAQDAVPGTDEGSDLARAQQAVSAAAGDVTTAQAKLATTVSELDKLVASDQTAGGAAPGGVHTSAATTGAATLGDHVVTAAYVTTLSSSGSSTGFSGGDRTVTAATIADDQASIDQARADLITARQERAGGEIKAPSRGRVAQVSVSRGGSASAGSTAVVVIAPGLATVQLSASSTQIKQLSVGQAAEVTPAGATRALTGKVTSVSNVPDSSGSSTTYPVTVTLARRDAALMVGTTASVDIVTGEADHALTVPTSAVSDGTVEVLDGDGVQRVRVTTGVVGRTRTVVTAGLQEGQQVVLADLSAALPSGDSTQQRGFGGAGGFGAGFGTTGGFGGAGGVGGFARRG